MSEFNEFFAIFYKDANGNIIPVLNENGGIILFATFNRANEKCETLQAENKSNTYLVHAIELNRELFR